MGVGRLANLDRVAKAGGTDHAFLVDDCPTAVEDLLTSLKRVANSPALCDFELPEPPPGELLDFDKVNLVFTPRGGKGEVVKRVDGEKDCASGGWYYDDAKAPKSVEVCPSTCSQFGGGVVDLVLGCETIDLK